MPKADTRTQEDEREEGRENLRRREKKKKNDEREKEGCSVFFSASNGRPPLAMTDEPLPSFQKTLLGGCCLDLLL